jgi:hypothetical protein
VALTRFTVQAQSREVAACHGTSELELQKAGAAPTRGPPVSERGTSNLGRGCHCSCGMCHVCLCDDRAATVGAGGGRRSRQIRQCTWPACGGLSIMPVVFFHVVQERMARTRHAKGLYTRALQQPVRLAYQPPASSTFLSEQTSHQQLVSSTLLSEQTSTSHQPPANRTGCKWRHMVGDRRPVCGPMAARPNMEDARAAKTVQVLFKNPKGRQTNRYTCARRVTRILNMKGQVNIGNANGLVIQW